MLADLGACWIHGYKGNPVTEIARREGLATKPTAHDDRRIYEAPGAHFKEAEEDAYRAWFDDRLERAAALARRGAERPLADGMRAGADRLPPRKRLYLEFGLKWIELVMGGPADRLSLRHWDHDEDLPGGDLLFPGGFDAVVGALAEGLDIRTGCVVRAVERGDAGVTLEIEDGSRLRAEACVLAVPLGVLKAGALAVEPPLPEPMREAIGRLEMGLLDKIVLRFPRRFWPRTTYLAAARADFAEYPAFFDPDVPGGPPMLVGLIAARSASRGEELSDEDAAKRAVSALSRMMDGAVIEPERAIVTRWGQDSFSRGSYSHLPAGASPADYDALAAPVGRLALAGEATHRRHPATVHGAYLSGVRAGRQLIRELDPGFNSTDLR